MVSVAGTRSKSKALPTPQCGEAAREYLKRGWSVIPAGARKKAAKGWKKYQLERPTEAEVDSWFRDSPFNVAVIAGKVSGGLAIRDFDAEGSYAGWAAANPESAKSLPTVATGRPGGRHVYFRLDPAILAEVREQLGASGRGGISLGDGELRADAGCYVLAPPSVHQSGRLYRWDVPLGKTLPTVDPREVGLLDCWAEEDGSSRPDDRAIDRVNGGNGSGCVSEHSASSAHSVYTGCEEAVERAIEGTQPPGVGHRRACLFQFARELKAIPELADKTAENLMHYVKQWHAKALPSIGTKEFETTRWDFLQAWEDVKFPAGTQVVSECFTAAKTKEVPACAKRYESPGIRALVAGCLQLQRAHGDQPFFLSCRTAGQALGVDHRTANVWLRGLTTDKVLKVVEKPPRVTGKAIRYEFIGAE